MLLATLCAMLLGTAGEAGAASKAPCFSDRGSPVCTYWKGKVDHVGDGDTIYVDVYGDRTSRPVWVRVTGINTTEQSRYSTIPERRRGECHALEATARIERLIKASHGIVYLAAQYASSHSGSRLRRMVRVHVNGRWQDAGQILIDEGHALWLDNGPEWAANRRYNLGAQKAAAAGLRIWDKTYCRPGPDDAVPLKVWVNWDADGTDGPGNLNGEWVKVKNQGVTDLPIGGWWLRDSAVDRYKFPAGAVIPAGKTITLYVGSRPGSDGNTTTHFYWNRSKAVFENVDSRGRGDGGYLFDPQGDLRAWMVYPCMYQCSDRLQGRVAVTARPQAPEAMSVINESDSPIDLEGYVLVNDPYVHSFGPDKVLYPGERLLLPVMGSPLDSTRLFEPLGKSKYILDDAGDTVRLRTATDIGLACYSWGSASC